MVFINYAIFIYSIESNFIRRDDTIVVLKNIVLDQEFFECEFNKKKWENIFKVI